MVKRTGTQGISKFFWNMLAMVGGGWIQRKGKRKKISWKVSERQKVNVELKNDRHFIFCFFFKYKNNWKKGPTLFLGPHSHWVYFEVFVYVLSKADFPVIFVPLPRQWWLLIPGFHHYPSVRLLPKHMDGWIWGLWLLFSRRKGGGSCFCFSCAFVSTFSQSCIYNPTGKIGFRHNSRAAASLL